MKFINTAFFCLIASSLYAGSHTPLIIGHRGACGHAPENTLLSFEKAIEFGVDAVELDVHCCKSGELIVIHDAKLDRTTNGKGFIKDLSLEEIGKYTTAENQIIPTLSQVIDFIDKRTIINIELKGPSTAAPVALLIQDYVQNKGFSYSNFIVSSFNHQELLSFHKLVPEVKTGAILEGLLVELASFAQKAEADFIVVHLETLSQELVDDAHQKDIKVLVYTVNDPIDISSVTQLHVDGIISNYPDRLSR